MDLSQILYSLGESEPDMASGAVSPPILQTSNFAYSTFQELKDVLTNEYDNSLYSRGHNPTVRLLEKKLAAIQGTEAALCFGSGSAGIAAAVITHLKQGDHVICVRHCYSWTRKLLSITLEPYGVEVDYIDDFNEESLKNVQRENTQMLILESPTSLNFHVPDIEFGMKYAKDQGWLTLIDNSYGSPLNDNFAKLQPDYIAHSATKFISGHSDVVAGVICGSLEKMKQVFYNGYMTFGAMLSPFDAWLLIRGLRTLPIRLEHSGTTADEISRFLVDHPKVSSVNDPFDTNHPYHERAKTQFKHRVSMFSFELDVNSQQEVAAFCDRLKVFRLAVSWGGYESLVLPACALPNNEHPIGLIRIYIGLESPESLIQDLKNAFNAIHQSS